MSYSKWADRTVGVVFEFTAFNFDGKGIQFTQFTWHKLDAYSHAITFTLACAFKRTIELRLLPTVYMLFVTPQNTELEKLICTARDSAEELKTYLSTITNIDLCDKDIGDEGVKVLADALVSNTTIGEGGDDDSNGGNGGIADKSVG